MFLSDHHQPNKANTITTHSVLQATTTRYILHILLTSFPSDSSDFLTLTNEQFTIPSTTPLNQDVCFDLSINGDEIREGDETFTVTITVGNSNDVIVGSSTVEVTILDDNDGMKTVLVSNDQQ